MEDGWAPWKLYTILSSPPCDLPTVPFQSPKLDFQWWEGVGFTNTPKEISCSSSSSLRKPPRNLEPGVLTHTESPRSSSVLGRLAAGETCSRPNHSMSGLRVFQNPIFPCLVLAGERAEAQRGDGMLSGPHSKWHSRTAICFQMLALTKLIFLGRLPGDDHSQNNYQS